MGAVLDVILQPRGICVQELKAYMSVYGDTLVPRNFWENPELGEWCYNMRIKYRELSLSQRQIKALEGVKFPWKAEMVRAHLINLLHAHSPPSSPLTLAVCVCVCVCAPVWLCTCVCACARTCLCLPPPPLSLSLSLCVCVSVCLSVCMLAHVSVHVPICVYVSR